MHPEYWLQRWQEGRTGFHHTAPLPLLLQYWPTLAIPSAQRVLVPLCGKSQDLRWLAEQGHRVLGVELSPLAVQQFFEENRLQPAIHDSVLGRHYIADTIEIIQGDFFALDGAALADCHALYDRAALIALPAPLRERYAHTLSGLPAMCQGLTITLEYPPEEKQGPPFSVRENDMYALFSAHWKIEQLARLDILADQPAFRENAVTALHTSVYHLQKRSIPTP